MIEQLKQIIATRSTGEHKIMKNTLWLSVAEIGSRIARGVLAIIAARMLGASGLGVWSYAIALGGFLTFFEDTGIGMFVTREFVKNSENKKSIFGTALVLKLLLLGIAVLFFLVIGPIASSLPGSTAILPIVALVIVFDSLRSFFFSICRAEQNMHIESKVQIATSFLVVLFGVVGMIIMPSPLSLAIGYALGGGIGCLIIFVSVKKYIPNIKKSFSKILFKEIFMSAWPFTILTISNILIFNTDTLFLGHYGTSTQVGLYSAASRLVQMFYILPSLFATATFPVLVQKAAGPDGIKFALRKSLLLMTAIMVPLVLVMTLGSKIIIPILFGSAFAPASIMLTILAFTYIPVFIGSVLNSAVFAMNNQKQFVIANILGMTINIILDFILVPKYQGVGAAIASVIGLSAITLVTIIRFKRITQ